MPSACAAQPSWPSLACRIEALLELVRASSALGPLQPAFVARFERAQEIVGDGAERCVAAQLGLARQAVQRVQRQMFLIRTRTRTLRARRIIPPPMGAPRSGKAPEASARSGLLADRPAPSPPRASGLHPDDATAP